MSDQPFSTPNGSQWSVTTGNTTVRLGTAVVVLTVIYCLVLIGFEGHRPSGLTYDGLWQARLGVGGSVLLLANFVAVWWYALLTSDLLRVALKEENTRTSERIQANRPIVVTVREEEKEGRFRYCIRNVGRRTAVNLWFVEEKERRPRSLGALEPGGQRPLSSEDQKGLREGGGVQRHIIVAEGIPIRSDRWTATASSRTPQAGGDMRHLIIRLLRTDHPSIDELLKGENDALRDQLTSIKATAT